MNKTSIEWCDYTWNPVTGCYGPSGTKEQPRHCPYCYAKRIAERFRGTKAFPNGFDLTLHDDRFIEPQFVTRPSRIFVCSMADLFGDWIDSNFIWALLGYLSLSPHHTFIFLTKNPKRLREFNPWPENAWVGATMDGRVESQRLSSIVDCDAKVKFVSFEPLLGTYMGALDDAFGWTGIKWIIIGAQTQPLHLPEKSWVLDIEAAADAAGVKLFEKDSLSTLFQERPLRREWPK